MKWALPLCALLLAGPILADSTGPRGGSPLPTIPRTKAEAARVRAVTTPSPDSPERFEARPGGATTPVGISVTGAGHAFAPSANLTAEEELDFITGAQVFERLWVSAPSSTKASDGLGPLYNARACSACHPGGGRGAAPGEGPGSALRLGRAEAMPDDPQILTHIEARPDSIYGIQLQDRSTAVTPAEGQMQVAHTPRSVTLSGGETVTLHQPHYTITEGAYGPLSADIRLSPRTAPALLGMGLLEAIPEADILALADPDDANGDGISGRPNWVYSRAKDSVMLGRFGHKAAEPTLHDQAAAAFLRDMGLSTHLHPEGYGTCTEAQSACLNALDGNTDRLDGVEVASAMLDLVVTYSAHLAPLARTGLDDSTVARGKTVFHETGCINCHTPKFVTDRMPADPALSFQLIWPHSDLLLHDMGPDLADDRREFGATGSEWRTAPLWGLGSRMPQRYLHDSRARSVLEAILWHGGEAAPHAQAVRVMDPDDRTALLAYLESL